MATIWLPRADYLNEIQTQQARDRCRKLGPMNAIALRLGFLALCLSNNPVQAQESQEYPPALVCAFTHSAVAESDRGSAAFTVESKDGRGMEPFIFAAINLQNRTAQLIGNAGSADVKIVVGSLGLTFVEITPAGNLNITAVSNYEEPASGIFRAVHSRNSNIVGAIVASQYYGTCEARR